MSVKLGTKLDSWKTNYSADSAEFCPVAPYQDVFVIGTYQLQQNTDSGSVSQEQTPSEGDEPCSRLGCLFLHRVNGFCQKLIESKDMSAILDIKWS